MNDERVAEYESVDEGQLIMPFYILCDVSSSMSGIMQELNESVERLRRAIITEPVVDDVAQICIISFSDTANVSLPMAQMSETLLPKLSAGGGTNYGLAFRLLARSIGKDIASLKAQGYKVYRPCAFFLTDGEPSDRDWYNTFVETLTYDRQVGRGLKSYPIFVPLGFRDASAHILRRLAYPPERGKWYHAKAAPVESAVSGILQVIMTTVISAGRTALTGHPEVTLLAPEVGSSIVQGDSEDWI